MIPLKPSANSGVKKSLGLTMLKIMSELELNNKKKKEILTRGF